MFDDTRSHRLAPVNGPARQTRHARHSTAGRSMHILAPTSLTPTDFRALRFAIHLAAMHAHTLTVLHVRPAAVEPGSCYGLDAIRLLHQAADRIAGRIALRDTPSSVDLDRRRVRAFLEIAFPGHLLRGVDLRFECRCGNVANSVAQCAEQCAADVVIMTGGLIRWWWPILRKSKPR